MVHEFDTIVIGKGLAGSAGAKYLKAAYQTKKCIISRTATKRPYIGETNQKGLYIALVCNGYSAMCADAIGNIAAHIVMEQALPKGYTKEQFTIVY